VSISKVLRSALNSDTLANMATSGSLSGRYTVNDAEWAATVIDAAHRIDRRALLPGTTGSASRSIPQHVKAEVWQRDADSASNAPRTVILSSTTLSRGRKAELARRRTCNTFAVAALFKNQTAFEYAGVVNRVGHTQPPPTARRDFEQRLVLGGQGFGLDRKAPGSSVLVAGVVARRGGSLWRVIVL
jgi:hypothetical protein